MLDSLYVKVQESFHKSIASICRGANEARASHAKLQNFPQVATYSDPFITRSNPDLPLLSVVKTTGLHYGMRSSTCVFCFPYQTANKAETIAPLPFRRLNRTCDETNTGQHPHQPPTQIASVSRELPQGCEVTQCTLMWFHKNNGYEEMADCRERTRAVLTLAICSSTIQCLMDSTILWKGKITEQLIRKEVTLNPTGRKMCSFSDLHK